MLSDSPALLVEQLRKRYGDRDVVDGLSLRAGRGELTAVLGPNGAGKTTTIECCEGLRRPDGGRIEVLGLDRSMPEAAGELRRRVGVMLQEGGLPMAPRAGAVLRHVARLHDRPAAADPLLERLGLAKVARTRVRHLSGGQRQRLALACAIVGEPELVFLDEPTAGLDPQARLAVWELVRELRAEGTSIVLTTHLMTEAEELADHVVVVDRGTDVAAGSPAALRGAPYVRISTPPGTDAVRLATDLDHALAAHPALRTTVEGGNVVMVRDREGGELDAAALAVVAGALATAGHGDAEVALTRPTLEDAFLALTGRELRVDAA
ncbi:ABC transporter ATP-binding protein [uncultured Georgenia sp.]|uniref:ABC transporter ATP-binding protein n=1 Tax=uncultured Georgenia sp. TaxID=378209 RepID=UPI002635280D|nr:ABC transporter ATP-binding protein [uncultured Georgenia sp.]